MRNEFLENYDPTIQGVSFVLLTRVHPNICPRMVRGVQEDRHGRWRINMGRFHLTSGGSHSLRVTLILPRSAADRSLILTLTSRI